MYTNITLEKGLYNISGKTFTQALRELDADENYIGTELEGLDAYERQLKRFDIKVSGVDSDRVEKFFKTTQSAVLFPEFVRRLIKQGMDEASILPQIVAAVTYTDGVDYRGLSIVKNGTDSPVSAGATLPKTTVSLADSTVEIEKYARQIETTYEVIRKQRLDLFAVVLKSIGAQISRAVNLKAINVMHNGSETTLIPTTTLTYSDITSFWASMTNYNMTTMLVSPAVLAKIMAFDEMKTCVGDAKQGTVKTPFGVTLIKCAGMSDDYIVGLDSDCALEMVLGSDVIVDNEKLISTQIDCIAFSISVGFEKVYSAASRTLAL